MASYTANRSVHKTLTGTTADTVTIGTAGVRLRAIEVGNPSASAAILYFTLSRSPTAPTTAVSAADDTHMVYPGSTLAIDFGGSHVDICTLSIVGSANAYNVSSFLA